MSGKTTPKFWKGPFVLKNNSVNLVWVRVRSVTESREKFHSPVLQRFCLLNQNRLPTDKFDCSDTGTEIDTQRHLRER